MVFTVDQTVIWVGCSLLDRENVTVTGNSIIVNITNGLHNIMVYANDTFRNIGVSVNVAFTINARLKK